MENDVAKLLRDLSVSLATSDDIHDAAHKSLIAALQLSNCEFGRVYALDKTGTNLQLLAYDGLNNQHLKSIESYDNDSDAFLNLNTGKTYSVSQENFDYSSFVKLTNQPTKSFITLPFYYGVGLIGCLNIISQFKTAPSKQVKLWLESIAAGLGSTMSRIIIFRQLEKNRDFISSLLNSASGFVVYQMVIDTDCPYSLRHTHVSPSTREVLGYEPEDWSVSAYYDHIHPDDQEMVEEAHRTAFHTHKYEAVARVYNPTKKAYVWIQAISIAVKNQEGEIAYVNGILIDVSDKQEALFELERKEKRLQEKTERLNQLNTTLNILLEKREKDRLELEQSFVYNIKEMVLPYMDKIRTIKASPKVTDLLDVIELNLKETTSRFMLKLSAKQLGLSPAEMKVAAYVKQGKTSKEIAQILGLSPKTIKNQRDRIRKKLGISGQKTNLRSYLLSLPQ